MSRSTRSGTVTLKQQTRTQRVVHWCSKQLRQLAIVGDSNCMYCAAVLGGVAVTVQQHMQPAVQVADVVGYGQGLGAVTMKQHIRVRLLVHSHSQ